MKAINLAQCGLFSYLPAMAVEERQGSYHYVSHELKYIFYDTQAVSDMVDIIWKNSKIIMILSRYLQKTGRLHCYLTRDYNIDLFALCLINLI